MVDILLTL